MLKFSLNPALNKLRPDLTISKLEQDGHVVIGYLISLIRNFAAGEGVG